MPVGAIGGASGSWGGSYVLGLGSRGSEVADLQQRLADAGFDPGGVDGAFGPMTADAVRAFQAANGCDVDGVVGPQTWAALDGAGSPAPAPAAAPAAVGGPHSQLQVGARGDEVIALQQRLAAAGCDPGPIDGDFGGMTRAAVVRFQAANGLQVDGVVGPQTWGALDGDSFVPGAPAIPSFNPGSGDFRSRILEIAQSQVGTVEATNNNDGAVTQYPGFFGRGQESYCADFTSWVLTQAGGTLNDPWCPSIRNTLINTGNWKGRTDPQPGDIVLFDWDFDGQADHVGLVKSVNGNGTLTCLEGNTGGPGGQEGVWETTRTWDFVMGFGNPV